MFCVCFPYDVGFSLYFFSGLSDITAPKGVIESNEQNFRLLENVEQRQHETSSFRKGQSVADGGSNLGSKGRERGRGKGKREQGKMEAFKCSRMRGVMTRPRGLMPCLRLAKGKGGWP